jgi:hypothetical protein
MLDSRSHKQQVARLKNVPFAVVDEHASTTNDEVNLVLCMWRLLAWAQRDGKGYIKSATPKGDDGVFARWAGDTCFGLGKADNTATIWVAHPALPCISKLRASNKTPTPGSLMA